jgi:6-phosphogluconolactonase
MNPAIVSSLSWQLTALLLIASSPAFSQTQDAEPSARKFWLYVGTYSQRGSKGIYRFEMDPATGKLDHRALAAEAANPNFLAIHPKGRFLYAVGDLTNSERGGAGGVSAFTIDPRTGDLTLLNQQSSGGPGPSHLTVDREGKHVLVANYEGGSVCVLPIGPDGRLGKATAFVRHQGHGPNPDRQESPHAHSINLDSAGRFAFAADLGIDKVMIYRFDATSGKLVANDPPAANVAPGSGPRHLAFHPDGRSAYVINELASTVTAFRYNPDKGVLTAEQTISTLPAGFRGTNTCAEVVVHPSGRFLYGSNRGHDSIAVFAINADTPERGPALNRSAESEPVTSPGMLHLVGHQGQGIKTPRNFAIDPTGKWLLVANQDGDSIVVFRIDPRTGLLHPTGNAVAVPMPVCLRMMPATG